MYLQGAFRIPNARNSEEAKAAHLRESETSQPPQPGPAPFSEFQGTVSTLFTESALHALPAALPLHHQSRPAPETLWRPEDYQSFPVLPDEVWRASRNLSSAAAEERLQALLLRLASGQTARLQVYGGSMTFGEGCCPRKNRTCLSKRTSCSWSTDFVHRLRQAFPSSSVELDLHARGGCDAACSLQEMAMTQASASVAPDWILLDFGQNGWGRRSTMEQFIRLIHLFLPLTLVTIVFTKDILPDPKPLRCKRCSDGLQQLMQIALHYGPYGVSLLSYDLAMQQYAKKSGENAMELMWPTINFNERHHPAWSTHALFADMLVSWCNEQLPLLERAPAVSRSRLAQLTPQLRKNPSLHSDDEWIRPTHPALTLATLEICIMPLTAHIARSPNPESPEMSSHKEWRLYEDRPAKPGWITNGTDEQLTFNMNISARPKIIVQYLRSYENVGQAEMSIESAWTWESPQLPNTHNASRFLLRALWEHRLSLTESLVFRPGRRGRPRRGGREGAAVSFRLEQGPKFKIMAVLSC